MVFDVTPFAFAYTVCIADNMDFREGLRRALRALGLAAQRVEEGSEAAGRRGRLGGTEGQRVGLATLRAAPGGLILAQRVPSEEGRIGAHLARRGGVRV